MGEKWFEFVKRIKKEGNHASLKDAMKDASARKSEWKSGKDHGMSVVKKSRSKKSRGRKSKKSKRKSTKKKSSKRKTRKTRK
jgi:hypothetical protein